MTRVQRLSLRILAFSFLSHIGFGQADRPLEWLRTLDELASTSAEATTHRVETFEDVRKGFEEWLALHPHSEAVLLKEPPNPWTDEQLRDQIRILKKAISDTLANDPGRAFSLGVAVVNVTASASALSAVTDSLDQVEIQNHNVLTVDQAIEYLPGVSVDHKAPRNQTGISIGGFDMRQVPLYLDGLPAYVPFDGFVDLTRYMTSDVAEVEVAKSYSSPLLGPNLLGGVINVVTRQPQKKLEGDAFIGGAAGNLLGSGLHLGSRWEKFFFQGGIDWLQSDYYPLSGAFRFNTQQSGPHRVNSDQRDERYRGRVAWTPRRQDTYVLSYSNQKGAEGVPPYAGTAPVCPTGNASVPYPCVTPKYWKWSYWNTDSYYFNSETSLGEASSVKFRAFYAQYPNSVQMFDDASYTTMQNPSSGILRYNDHSIGASGEFDTRILERHSISGSFFVKDDTHREQTTTFPANVNTTTPEQTDRDQQSSFGFQDAIRISSRLRATAGFSADHLNGLEAQDLNSAKTLAVPFQVTGVCAANGTSFSSCTDHVWSYNPVASLSYTVGRSGTLFATFAQKGRFPTLKDRYSFKAGKAVPDPGLLPEKARNWTAGYSRAFALRTVAQVDFFRSDVKDEIENVFFLSPLCAGGSKGGAGACMQAVNTGKEIHEGMNFSIRSTAVWHVTLDGNYTYLNRSIMDSPGVFPTGTPKHKSRATITARLPHGAMGMLSAQYQSGAAGMSDNSLPLPEAKFTTVDLGGAMPLRLRMTLHAGIKNLLDRNYYYWEGFPQEGRNWYFTFRYQF
jgi:iron complex outermembrane receptor protein